MQHNRSTLGPRGWAILTLAAGAGLASPFLRPPQVDLAERVSESPMAPTSFPAHLATARRERSTRQGVLGASDSLPHGTLPEHGPSGQSPTQIPEWATPPSRLDQLISQGAAPPWRHENVVESPKLPPLDPWTSLPSLAPPPRPTAVLPQPSAPVAPATPGSLTATNITSALRSPSNEPTAAPPAPRRTQFVYQPGYPQPPAAQAAP